MGVHQSMDALMQYADQWEVRYVTRPRLATLVCSVHWVKRRNMDELRCVTVSLVLVKSLMMRS